MSKRVPKLRFKEFESDGEWEEKRLGEIVKINGRIGYRGYTVDDIVPKGQGAITLSPSDFINNIIDISKSTYISWFKYNESPEIQIENGDILFVKTGSTYGKIAYVSGLNEKATINPQIVVFKDITVNNYFLYNYFLHNFIRNQIEEIVGGGTIPTISQKQLAKIKFFIPKPKEQQKIANTLSSLDNLIMSEDKKLQALQTYKKGLMQQLFPKEGERVPKLRFKEFESDGEWEEKKIGDIFKVTRGEVLSMNMVEKNSSKITPYPVYSSQTKNNGLAGYYSDYLFENAITWTTDGANAGDVNFRKGKFYCTNVCGVLINTNGYANQFIAELLNTVTKKHVSYVGNPKLMNGVMASIIIPIPSLQEQQKIANTLSSLDNLIENQSKKIEALKEHKKGLMQQMFVSEDS